MSEMAAGLWTIGTFTSGNEFRCVSTIVIMLLSLYQFAEWFYRRKTCNHHTEIRSYRWPESPIIGIGAISIRCTIEGETLCASYFY